MRFSLVFAIVLTALVVTFSLQNSHTVQVQFLAWYFEGALVLTLLMTFTAGALTMYLASLPRRFARRREVAELKRQVNEYHRKTGLLHTGKPTGNEPQG